ncbi:Shufflon-specific DNA recombinase [hydrothermal vent metagenome]|uniref:Shufflon-specific DNA recombinase n=1 Tax=hydrothermal vent metagenome TaxID=652676 RepID=A0A3B1APB9_9ZZZZ
MPTYRKVKNRWRAEVRLKGKYKSKTFSTKAEAREWATDVESTLTGKREGSAHLIRDAFERYAREVSMDKKGAKWELVRLNLLGRYDLADVSFAHLAAEDLAVWRDWRLREVSGATVNRELNLISSVFERARKEWGWCVSNPVRDISRPKKPRPRDRRISDEEIERVLCVLGYDENDEATTCQQLTRVLFLLGIETAMRRGEMMALRWSDIHLQQRYVSIVDSKNLDQRDVPLTTRAVELLERLTQEGEGPFSFSSDTASTLFRRAVKKAEIDGLRLHDSRHEGLTRLARKLDVLDLARMVGHRNPRSLMIYYNATVSEIASRLD